MKNLTVAQKRARLESVWAEQQFRRYGDGVEGFKAWCSELYYVRNKTTAAGRSLFGLYDFQQELADAYFSNRYHVVLKSRQLGATTLAMALGLWRAIYTPGGANVLCLSKTQVDARSNLDQVAHAMNFFPDWYTQCMPTISAMSADRLVLEFADGATSTLEAMVATERSGASRTASLVIADEAALWSHPEETMRSLAPTTDAAAASPGTEAVMLVFSTARGGSNYFANLWRDAHAGRNGYRAHFVPWTRNPLSNPAAGTGEIDYSVVNARKAEFAGREHLFHAEYPLTPEDAFLSSGHSRFPNLKSVTEFEEFAFRGGLLSTGKHPQWFDADDGHLFLNFDPRSEQPALHRQIVIGADPALGVGGDSSVAYVMARATDGSGEVDILGYWASSEVEPTEFADALWDLGWFFGGASKGALLSVEVNPSAGGGGQTVIGRLRDRGYSNLFQYVQPAARGRKALSMYGMPITRATKPLLVNRLAEFLHPDEVSGDCLLQGIPPILRDELGSFVVKPNGSVAADAGSHDDHVLAAAICLYALTQNVRTPTVKQVQVEPSHDGNQRVLTLDLSEIRRDLDSKFAAARKREARARRSFNRRTRRPR